jgi:hypothetical protein
MADVTYDRCATRVGQRRQRLAICPQLESVRQLIIYKHLLLVYIKTTVTDFEKPFLSISQNSTFYIHFFAKHNEVLNKYTTTNTTQQMAHLLVWFGLVWFGLFVFNRSTAGTDKCREI